MKMSKLALAACSFLLVGTLVGCGGNKSDLVDEDYALAEAGALAEGFTSLENKNANKAIDEDGNYTAGGIKFKTKDTFKTTYVTEPTKDLFNYLTNTWTYNSYHYCNMVDGLVENDKYGNIVGALALGYKSVINADGTQTWSFQLRENAEWVNNKTGKKVADVVADDFVAAARYVLNPANGAGAANLYTDYVKGAQEYFDDMAAEKNPSFDSVGVKAASKYVVEYTLSAPTPYFITVLTYSPFLPVNGDFLESQGTNFGKTVNNILVNGAFRITKHVPENKMNYAKNFHYYDRDHTYLNHVERKFVPGTSTPDTVRTWYEAGIVDSFSVSAKDKTGYEKYVTGADKSGSLKNPIDPACNGVQSYYTATFIGYYNFNRINYEFAADAHTTTAQERKDTNLALFNKNFRLGFLYGLKADEFAKQLDPDEPYNYIMRGYTNKELVSEGGKDFTDFVNDVYNEKQGTTGVSLIGIDNGSDPVYSADKAAAAFAAAKVELDAAGVTYPIYIDMIGDMEVEAHAFEEAMVAPLEAAATINGVKMIKINWNVPSSDDQNTKWGSIDNNFDFSLWSGWGPDYADPKTFAATWKMFGDMVEYVGFPTSQAALEKLTSDDIGENIPAEFKKESAKETMLAMMNAVLGEYNTLYEAADAIVDASKLKERYEAFALAEYNLIYESAIILPWYTRNGYTASVSKTVPWQAGRASYGLTSDKFKNVIATESPITKEQRKAVTDEYDAGK